MREAHRRASVASRSFFRLGDINDTYIVGQVIGTGNHAEVHVGQHRETKEKVAIKVLSLSREVVTEVLNEIDILARVDDHPHVIKLKEIYEKDSCLFVVMELVTGGELFDRVLTKPFSESEARDLCHVLFQTIAHMHSCGVVHRDLKPENILYSDRSPEAKIKIADFGLAKVSLSNNDKDVLKTFCGTPGYVAPEIVRNKTGFYTSQCDMWSIGVILYIVLCGYPPFQHEQQSKLFKQILKADYKFHSPWWDNVGTQAKDLVSKLLVVNPKKRLTPQQAMTHPFMKTSSPGKPVDLDWFSYRLQQRKFRTITNSLVFAQKFLQVPQEALCRTRSRVSIADWPRGGSESESDASTPPSPVQEDINDGGVVKVQSRFHRLVVSRLSK